MIVRKHLSIKKIFYFTWQKVLFLFILSFSVSVSYHYLDVMHVAIPTAPGAVLGTALAILLGFRNNSAYDRWWEGRRLWGIVVNESRNIARQISTFYSLKNIQNGDITELKSVQKEMTYRILAYCYSLKNHLRKTEPLAELAPFLPANELSSLTTQQNIPASILHTFAKRLQNASDLGYIEDFRHMQIDTRLSSLTDAMGGCERIKNTVFPRQYSYYTSVFTWIFIILIPFSLVEQLGYFTIVATVVVGFIFFVLDTIGGYIENPFENSINDTPMNAICRTIEINLKQILGETDLPEPVKPIDGFLF